MAQAARRLDTGMRSETAVFGAAQPANDVSPTSTRMAMDVYSSQLRSRRDAEAANDNAAEEASGMEQTDSLEQSEHPVLELEPRSYARREETEWEQERHRQEQMMETARRFRATDREEIALPSESEEEGFQGRIPTEPRGDASADRHEAEMDRYRELEEQKAKQALNAAGKAAALAGGPIGKGVEIGMEVGAGIFGAKGLIAIAVKMGTVGVNPIWVLCCVNLEAIHALIPFITLPPSIETKLILLGLDLSKRKTGAYKIITIGSAFFMDVMAIALLCLLAAIIMAIIYLLIIPITDTVQLYLGG